MIELAEEEIYAMFRSEEHVVRTKESTIERGMFVRQAFDRAAVKNCAERIL